MQELLSQNRAEFKQDFKEASGRFNLANLRLDVLKKKANVSEGGVVSGVRESVSGGRKDNIVSIRSALTNLEIPSMRILGKIRDKSDGVWFIHIIKKDYNIF